MIFTVTECRAAELELRRLVAISRLKNKKRGITGCLFWTGQYLAQVLEGPSDALGHAMRTMCADGRQAAPRVLLQAQISLRQFELCPLAYVAATHFDDALRDAHATARRPRYLRVLHDLLVQEFLESEPASVFYES